VYCAALVYCAFIGAWVGGIALTIPGGWRASAGRAGQDAVLERIMAKTGKQLQSGKRGTVVSIHTAFGQAERQLAIPRNPRTPAQQRVRVTLGSIASRWRVLTDGQRAAWSDRASNTHSRARLGQSGRLTGCQLFIKINCTLAAAGMEQVVEPPDRPAFAENPVGALTITNDAGVIRLLLAVPRAPAHYVMVLGTSPCSAGIARPRRFTLLGALPAADAGMCDVTDLYVARYGVPPVGARVFIRTRQTVNGWEDLQKDTTAIVPAE
jgi:hypothetical protein